MMRGNGVQLHRKQRLAIVVGAAVAAGFLSLTAVRAQVVSTGHNIVPVFEGWEENPDGSFSLVFGYYNRNWDEELDLPIGPNNSLSPGMPDQGQPTHFYPRRNRFVFRVRVPKDFGNKEVVWTLTSKGQTERAYGTLKADYFINDIVIMNNNGAGGPGGGAPETIGNVGPSLSVDGEKFRRAKVGETIDLSAIATDDGKPKARPMPMSNTAAARAARGTPNAATGLRLAWSVYRGPNKVTFDPPQAKVWEDYRDGMNSPWAAGWAPPPVPPGGKWRINVKFSEPGTYVLRCEAHDGGLSVTEDITFVVAP
jgi:hypothetical protein